MPPTRPGPGGASRAPLAPRASRLDPFASLLGRGLARVAAWLPFPRGGVPTGETAPRSLALFLALFLGGLVLISLLGDQGLIAYRRLQGQAAHLRGEVALLQARRVALGARIRALREDPAYIELVARRRLGLVRPGETIVQLPRPRERP